MIFRVVIWGAGGGYNRCYTLIKHFEDRGEISVVGIIADFQKFGRVSSIDGYPLYEKKHVQELEYDYCIVTIDDFNSIIEEAESLSIPRKRLIPSRVLSVPYFRFDDYIRLRTDGISIVSINCFGGICYHYLALEFLSPTINMFFIDSEFNRFIENMDYYLSCPVRFEGMRYERNLKRDYPVGLIDDIHVHFNHAVDFDDAVNEWERRKTRLVDNRLYVSCTQDKDVALRFSRLPFSNKIIFVPKEIGVEGESIFGVDYHDDTGAVSLGMFINDIANGRLSSVNVFGLCCNQGYDRNT